MLFLLMAAYSIFQPGTDGVVKRAVSPAGIECEVTRRWNGWGNGGEPYTVDFRWRHPGKEWQQRQIDFEARRWWTCRLDFDVTGEEATVMGPDDVVRRFNLEEKPHHE